MSGERITEDGRGHLVVQQDLVEVLNGIRTDQTAGFSRLETALQAKADRSDVSRIEATLDHHETERRADSARIAELEAWRAAERESRADEAARETWRLTRRQKIGGGIVAVAAAIGVYVEPIITAAVSHH